VVACLQREVAAREDHGREIQGAVRGPKKPITQTPSIVPWPRILLDIDPGSKSVPAPNVPTFGGGHCLFA
jgi:hypothetical protein